MSRPTGTARVVRGLALLVALFALLLVPASGSAQEGTPASGEAVARAAAWLAGQAGEDGGYVGFQGTADPGVTADAVIALAAARSAGADVDLEPAVAYLEANALAYAQSGPGQAAKLALAVAAAGGDPRDAAGVDPLTLAERSASEETGLYGFGVFDHALTMLALAAAGDEIPAEAVEALRAAQIAEGSWAFDGSTSPGAGDTNTTAMAIQALAAAGQGDDPAVEAALAYLREAQGGAGGFAFQPGDGATADANSTALVVQALIAAGQDPAGAEWNDALGALLAFQNPSGAFRYNDDQPDDNLFATVQALPAVAGRALPIVPAADEGTPAAEAA